MTIAQQIRVRGASIEAAAGAHEFAEYARALMMAKGNREDALHYAGASSRRVVDAIKADIAGGTTDSMDAIAPYRALSEGFTSTLANAAFDGVLGNSIQVPLHTQLAVVTADATAAVAGEGLAKRISSISLDGLTLQERKAAAIIAVSDDLLKFSSATALLENSLRTGVAAAVNSIFLTAMIAGTTPIAATANVFTDLKALTDATGSGSESKFHLVVSPVAARHLSLANATSGLISFPG